MKTLKIEDNSNGVMEISRDNILIDNENDVPGVSISQKWDGQETFVSIIDVDDLTEIIKWLSIIKTEMVAYHKNNSHK